MRLKPEAQTGGQQVTKVESDLPIGIPSGKVTKVGKEQYYICIKPEAQTGNFT